MEDAALLVLDLRRVRDYKHTKQPGEVQLMRGLPSLDARKKGGERTKNADRIDDLLVETMTCL